MMSGPADLIEIQHHQSRPISTTLFYPILLAFIHSDLNFSSTLRDTLTAQFYEEVSGYRLRDNELALDAPLP